jgi:hypothetical protein
MLTGKVKTFPPKTENVLHHGMLLLYCILSRYAIENKCMIMLCVALQNAYVGLSEGRGGGATVVVTTVLFDQFTNKQNTVVKTSRGVIFE